MSRFEGDARGAAAGDAGRAASGVRTGLSGAGASRTRRSHQARTGAARWMPPPWNVVQRSAIFV
ncbi:MAG: hypothetical protein IPJ14_12090 [Kineosporiaceae bacterium]|nr:hypothetical protein [Kineosporiaceae bacterium]MBK7623364.1 hypothetical protein [Kineosporiaceae bacterium]